MATAAINITIEQGEDFSATYTILNPDKTIPNLSNYTVAATLKKYPDSSTSYVFVSSLVEETGIVAISLSNSITKTLVPGRYYYDIFLISPLGIRSKKFDGNALVNASATLSS